MTINTLGIDFGLRKVGVAIAMGTLAEPYIVIRYQDIYELIKCIKEICEKEKVGKIVVGISEGEMAEKTNKFIEELRKEVGILVEKFDETLSTADAQRLSMEAHMKRSKRKRMEDAMAAAVMLQSYMDSR